MPNENPIVTNPYREPIKHHDWPEWSFLEFSSLEQVKDLRNIVNEPITARLKPERKAAS